MKWFKNLKAHFPAARTELAQVDTPPIDHRWTALGSNQIICDCCGVDFCDLLSIGYAAPEDWPHTAGTENRHTVDLNGGDFLTQICVDWVIGVLFAVFSPCPWLDMRHRF
jgi:hypothetical protein